MVIYSYPSKIHGDGYIELKMSQINPNSMEGGGGWGGGGGGVVFKVGKIPKNLITN